MKIIGTPGHFQLRQDTNHFLGRCGECDIHYMAGMTLDEAEYRFQTGDLSEDQREAFRHVWATGAPRFGSRYGDWTRVPDSPEVRRMVEAIREVLKAGTFTTWNEPNAPGDGTLE
jgi:hypothetical protein